MAELTQKTCPYCQTQFRPGEHGHECPQCHIPHHEDCWRENGGCTTFGCTGQQPAGQAAPPTGSWSPSQTSDHIELSLEDLSRCAVCGADIPFSDETCRHCGTPTDLPPSLARGNTGRTPAPYAGMPAQPYQGAGYGYQPPPFPACGQQLKSPAAACLLNLLLLGAGYFYLNQIGKGFTVLAIGIVGICFSYGVITLVMLIFAMVDCYQIADRMNRGLPG